MNLTQRSESGLPPRKTSTRRDQTHLFTISDMSKEFGVTLRTLRFYEDRGLLTPQRDGTSRFYSEQDKARLALILKGKQLGFTLGEIRDLITTKRGAPLPKTLALNPEQIATQISHLERQKSEIDEAIEELRAAHSRLMARA